MNSKSYYAIGVKDPSEKNVYYLIINTALALLLGIASQRLVVSVILLIQVVFWLTRKCYIKQICLYIIYSYWLLNSEVSIVILGLIIVTYLLYKNCRIGLQYAEALGPIVLVVLLSYFYGIDSAYTTAIVAVIGVIMGFICANSDSDGISEIIISLTLSGLCIIAYVFYQYLSGVHVYLYRRLSLNNSIRDLANACVIPLIFLVNSILCKRRYYFKKIVTYIFIFLLSSTLLMTASRGAIFAFASGVIVAIVFSGKNGSVFSKLFLIMVLLGALLFIANTNSIIRLSRLLSDEGGGFHGRTNIWRGFFDIMLSGGAKNLIFGLGPGGLQRFGTGYYAHSSWLDTFFSYGISGSIVLICGLLIAAFKILKAKSLLSFSIFIAVLLNYSTHGTIANIDLFIALGLAIAMSSTESVEGV